MRQLELAIEAPSPPRARRPVAAAVGVEPGAEAARPRPPRGGPSPTLDALREARAQRDAPARPSATVRGQARIEAYLRAQLGPRVLVRLTQNRSTMISCSVKRDVVYVRLHAIFADAPEHVLTAVGRFVTEHPTDETVAWLIDRWIEAHRHLVKNPPDRPAPLPRGEVHDLQAIYDTLNARYFAGRVDAKITWSVAARKRKRRSIRMGSYSADERLIRIHPALDQDFVPEWFVASVVFHEMLHQLHGHRDGADGCRRVHTAAFRRDEEKFPEHARARLWEAQNIHRLLRF